MQTYSVFKLEIPHYERLSKEDLLNILVELAKAVDRYTYTDVEVCGKDNINDIVAVVASLKELKDVVISATSFSTEIRISRRLSLREPCLRIRISYGGGNV